MGKNWEDLLDINLEKKLNFYFNNLNELKEIQQFISAISNDLNYDGGYLIYGIDTLADMVVGIEQAESVSQTIKASCLYNFNFPIQPDIKIVEIDNLAILVIFIRKASSAVLPVYIKSETIPHGAFRCVGRLLFSFQMDDFFALYNKAGGIENIILYDSNLDTIQPSAFSWFKKKILGSANLDETIKNEDWLKEQDLGRFFNKKFHLNLIGLLFLGKANFIKKNFPQCSFDLYIGQRQQLTEPQLSQAVSIFGNIWDIAPKLWLKFFPLLNNFSTKEDENRNYGIFYQNLFTCFVYFAITQRNYLINQPAKIIINPFEIIIIYPGITEIIFDESIQFFECNQWQNPALFNLFMQVGIFSNYNGNLNDWYKKINLNYLPKFSIENLYQTEETLITIPIPQLIPFYEMKIEQIFATLFYKNCQINIFSNLSHKYFTDHIHYRNINVGNLLNSRVEFAHRKELVEVGLLTNMDKPKLVNDGEFVEWHDVVIPFHESSYFKTLLSKFSGIKKFYQQHPNYSIIPFSASRKYINTITDNFQNEKPSQQILDDDLKQLLQQKLTPQVFNKLPNVVVDEEGNLHLKKERKPLPQKIQLLIDQLGNKSSDPTEIKTTILKLCRWKPLTLEEISFYLQRNNKYLLTTYIKPLRLQGFLSFTKPKKINHPSQKYKTVKFLKEK